MEGFKKLTKGVKCFKEGGSVYKSRHSEKSEKDVDIKQDKAVVKKAFAMHDKQEHPGEKTDLSKLKKGGRAKKAQGTVKKYACGGGVYGAKKTKEDIKSIDSAKDCKPKKLAAGGPLSATDAKLKALEEQRALEKMARAKKYLGPSQQSELIKQSPAAAGLSGPAMAGVQAPAMMPPVDQMGAPTGPAMKKGGKAKKMMSGGTCS